MLAPLTLPARTPSPPPTRASLAVPLTSFGFFRKSWKIFHSPCPGVPPNAAGCEVGHVEAEPVAFASAARRAGA